MVLLPFDLPPEQSTNCLAGEWIFRLSYAIATAPAAGAGGKKYPRLAILPDLRFVALKGFPPFDLLFVFARQAAAQVRRSANHRPEPGQRQ
jgi:hypothetical protein